MHIGPASCIMEQGLLYIKFNRSYVQVKVLKMSFLFRGLTRLIKTENEYVEFQDTKIGEGLNEITTTGLDGKTRKVVLNENDSGGVSEVNVFTKNQFFFT